MTRSTSSNAPTIQSWFSTARAPAARPGGSAPSRTLTPVRRGHEERLAEFLSYVEAIPMEVLRTVNMSWETVGEYMDTLDKRLGVNVGNLIGQSGGGRDAELDNGLMTRLAEACGRQVVYNNLGQSVCQPEAWKQHMALVDATAKAGIRANPLCTPNSNTTRFTMRNTQAFRGIPTWHPI